nr:response regulator [Desulfobulbaceae bacterium]
MVQRKLKKDRQEIQHILFAESEHGLERSISLMLKMANYKVTVVTDCLEAYEKLVELEGVGELPELLIVDFGRNKANSERFVESLTQSRLSVPVIIIAEYGDEWMVAEGVLGKSGVFLAKPFEPQELMSAVEKLLSH